MKKELCSLCLMLFLVSASIFAQSKEETVSEEIRKKTFQMAYKAYMNGDKKESIRLLEPYALKGEGWCQNRIGIIYEEMNDFKSSLYWYKICAANDDGDGQFNAGRLLDKRYGRKNGIQQSDDQAINYYTQAANNKKEQYDGSKYAIINLFAIYKDNKDSLAMRRILEKSVKEKIELEKSPFLLASIFYKKDPSRSFGLYRISAENGHSASQYLVGKCFENGTGTERDMNEAAKWYQRAADQGNWDAQNKLGYVYENLYRKTMDERHLRLSLKWYYKARQDRHIIDLGNLKDNVKREKDGKVRVDISNTGPIKKYYDEGALGADKYSTYEVWVDSVVAKLAVDSDVDINIPQKEKNSDNTFVLIIANENYEYEQYVPYAENDGVVFAKYCYQTLGIPEKNIHIVVDAGLNKMKREIDWLISNALAQNASKTILYYSGHGVPAEDMSTSFLLPVDGYAKDPTTGYDLTNICEELGKLNTESIVLLDACFSGSKRKGGMLVESKGVAVKVKQAQPKGRMVIMSACQGTETAYPYEDQKHGLFTYFLLKKLQETKGNISVSDLFTSVKQNVSRESLKINNKSQTPAIAVSDETNLSKIKL